MDVLLFQSSDAFRYLPMLSVTAPNLSAYCERHGFTYEAFIGLKRGYWPWQATFNRIVQYRDLLDRGFAGWAIHVDADAWIHDLDFDLRAYLADKHRYSIIMASAGVTGDPWDFNAGVILLNLASAAGRRLVELWHADFMALSDATLRDAKAWLGTGNDQDLLQQIVRREAALAATVFIESKEILNSRRARFIRQHLRTDTSDLPRRIANIAAEVAAVTRGAGHAMPVVVDDRAQFGLRHPNPNGDELSLVEAPAGPPDTAAAAAAIARWHAMPDRPASPSAFVGLRAQLEAGDPKAVASSLSIFGRTPAAEGLLGGERQHRRAAEEPAFAIRRAVRTQDALVSLAEAVGALAIENPDYGLYGFNIRRPAAQLLDAIGTKLGADVSPPTVLGSYLGLDAGDGRVLHLRMIEALHSAARLRQVLSMLDLDTVVDLDGGLGFRAFYAARLGLGGYVLKADPIIATIQDYLLRASGLGSPNRLEPHDAAPGRIDLLFNEETLSLGTEQQVAEAVRFARELGVRAIMNVNHEAHDGSDAPRMAIRDVVLASGAFRSIQRMPHAIRPGFVEELFVAN